MCPPWEEEGRIRSYVAAARPPFLCKEERIPRVSISPTVHPKVHPFRTNLAIFSLSFPSSFHSLIARNQKWKIFDPKRARAQGGKIVGCGRRKLLSLSPPRLSFACIGRSAQSNERERERGKSERGEGGGERERTRGIQRGCEGEGSCFICHLQTPPSFPSSSLSGGNHPPPATPL